MEPLQSFRATYRRRLEEMAALGNWEDSWKESVKASVLHGPEKFVMAMLQELHGDRREQRGIREKERLGLEWPIIIGAIATVWKEPWEVISVQRRALGQAYYLRQRHAGITLRELGRYVGEVEYPAVSLAIARFEKRLKTDRLLEKRLQVIKLLNVEPLPPDELRKRHFCLVNSAPFGKERSTFPINFLL
jgi:hypothetical protein